MQGTYFIKAKTPVSVSILICVKNAEKYIANCISSILNQTFTDFEIVVIEEFDSSNKTQKIIENFKDKRIRYFKNEKWLGLSKSRNRSVMYAKGDYLFFTDSDCIVSKDWVEQGLKFLKDTDCLGVEGKSYYVSEEYEPTFSDHTYEMNPGGFMTNNIAYKRSIVKRVGGFDERYTYLEDRDLGLRVLRFGKIKFNPNMKVFVQKHTMTPKALIRRSEALRNTVFLFKRFGERQFMAWRIVDPRSLAKILFPPIIFTSLISKKFKHSSDFKLFPFVYVSILCQRLHLWKECAKERVFMI
jgi:glycosyltransferase involved in cell wall biosynthesis